MAILTHGSDLTLAPTLGPLVKHSGQPVKMVIDALTEARFGAVQLDATMAGLRPRELDRGARRDLAALLVRRGLQAAGIDLFVPRKHLAEAEHVDRAVSAIVDAIGLAAELCRIPLSIAVPIKQVNDDVKRALVEAADGHGVALAVHAEDQMEALRAWVEEVDLPALGIAIDPAALLARKIDPAKLVHETGKHVRVARLSDLSRNSEEQEGGGQRCVPGEGDLDITAYRIALDFAKGRRGPVVLDLRNLANPPVAAQAALSAWDDAGFNL